jgi:salicylate hydroxylase
MAPAMGQGANTTFEDAYELAQCFSHSVTLEAALANYEQSRIDRTKIIQARSALGEMRYYDDTFTSSNHTPQRQMTLNDDFHKWIYSYKPNVLSLI